MFSLYTGLEYAAAMMFFTSGLSFTFSRLFISEVPKDVIDED